MLKKVVAFILIASLLSTFSTSGFGAGIEAYPKNGFRLVAQESDSTGIAVDTEFLLETEKDYSLEEIRDAFSIDGEPMPVIEEMDTNMYSINLSRKLLENSLYTFRIKTDTETTWVFQTQESFKIVSSLPAEKSVNVPVNSGIEVNFSHENFSDIQNFFEITPYVNGRFEVHKKTAVFVPDSLQYETVYTVKVKKGIKIQGTERTIDEDFVFTFETQSRSVSVTPPPGEISTYLYFGRYLYDFASDENPEVLVNYSSRRSGGGIFTPPLITAKNSIYAFKDFNSFVKAIEEKNNTPYWAQSYNKKFTSVDGLQKVLEFEQVISDGTKSSGSTYLKVPQTLPEGYYVLDSYWENIRLQTFLQITNTGIYIAKSNTKTLVWLNDLLSKNPIEGASITFKDIQGVNYSDADGVAYFDSLNMPGESVYQYRRYNQYLIVTTRDGKSSLLDCIAYYYNDNNKYWSYLYTDRDMYKPDDAVNIWGFIKNRYNDEEIGNLSLEISQGYYGYYYKAMPIVKQNIDVKNSFFEGVIKLPDLPKGYYCLTIKKSDKTVLNKYFRVENYTKPSYKIEVTKDKEAIFVDEEANFNIKSAFFEGTGVSNLNVNYSVSSYNLGGNISNQTGMTDVRGNLNVKYSPSAGVGIQGEQWASFNVRALFPESGEIRATSSLRVFVNDIYVKPQGEIKDGKATIRAQVNNIVLDRINSGTAKNGYDYLGGPVNGKNLTGTIYKNTWNRIENGTYYDYINKVTHKLYRYQLVSVPVKDFYMVTSEDGYASYVFDAPKIADTYYSATLNTVDGRGRNMTYNVYLGQKLDYSTYQYKGYSLEGNKSSYGLGESVDLTFKYGNEPLPAGSYLYYRSQNGIYDYVTATSSSFSFNFSEKDIPNTQVNGVYFNGKTYVSQHYNAVYNAQEKNLSIEVVTDKDFYKPGDQVTLSLNVKDINGMPVKSTVNISIVDEAFFKLADQNVNLLQDLYTKANSGVYYQGRSHNLNSSSSNWGNVPPPVPTAVPVVGETGRDDSKSSNVDIREDFRDTAQFITVKTDDNGIGQISFKLPDNVTSWRVTLSAISDDLHAGSDKASMIVTLPFFINYSFNTTYLEGDKPILGVNAYGNGLKENDEVTFEVNGSGDSSPKLTVTGKAFERINIPLWALEEGKQDLIIKAYTNNGYSDALKHTFNVVKSYYQIEKADYFDLAPDMTISGGKSGYTRVVFQDKSKGMFLWDLISLRYSYGNRIDQIISKYTASELISKYFKDYTYSGQVQKPSLGEYQKTDGGLSLLPYSESDLELTAKLASLAKSLVDSQKLKNYYYGKLDSTSTQDKVKALYGLSVLKEPVLLMLEKTALIDNLSTEDLIYLALAYCELGDIWAAEQIYNNRIYKYVEEYEPYFRVNTGGDKDDILEATSLCAYLASRIKRPESIGLYQYCQKNYAEDILLGTEKLLFISTEIENNNPMPGTVTYTLNGEDKTVSFGNWSSHSLSLMPFQLATLKIKSVEGDVSAVSIYKTDILETSTVDQDISVKRTYLFSNGVPLTSNTLKQGDVIKVRLEWDMSAAAFDGVYEITDYLPSGLKPYNSYYNTEGQRISFYIYNSPYWKSRNYIEYNARVISAGTYTAQGPIIQGKTSRDNINCGKSEIITIEATEPVLTPVEELPYSTPTPIKNILYGDLDGDKKISSIDFALLRMYILGMVTEFTMPNENADLNGDGSINSIDMAFMRLYLLGYITEFPVVKS